MSHNSYELLFITDPALAPENLTALQDRIGSILTANNGEVEGIDDWGVRRLAYQINRLDEGRYGHCYECGDEIAEARLRALPFAVRCKDCEEEREVAIQRERTMARRGTSGFFDLSR